jgi:hypothetical protein
MILDFKLFYLLKNFSIMNLQNLEEQFRGRKFGELVLHHLSSQSDDARVQALQGTIRQLPSAFQQREMEELIDDFNKKIYDKSFWEQDCADSLLSITNTAKKRFLKCNLSASDDDLFNVFNIIVLNYAYTAQLQPEMKSFIKKSVNRSFFDRLFSKD